MPAEQAPSRNVLLFEMNEVPWRVIDDFVARHPQSELAAMMRRSKQLETVCEDQLELDPWTSWPTLHRGVIDERHGIRHLGQALDRADAQYPPIWELLARSGRSVGVFGSLHSSRVPASLQNYAFYVPDCFADEPFAHPRELQAFQAFNLLMTRRSARNVDAGIPLRAAAAFLRQYVRAGLDWSSLAAVAGALAAERRRPHLKTRRRSLQPLIGLDVFLPLVRRTRPQFATFYTNHVAANMHRFWAAAFPEDLPENEMPMPWRHKYAGEIDYAMEILDGMLRRLRALADSADYLLLAASSIGQGPVPASQVSGFVTLTDLERFMARLGLAASDWKRKPAMVPCISVWVDAARAGAFEEKLGSLVIGGRAVRREEREGHEPAFTYSRTGDGCFHFCVYFEETDPAELPSSLGGVGLAAAELGLGFFPHEEEVANSGRHTPFGALFVYDPRRPAGFGERATISTLSLAPALLHNFGVPAPAYMAACDRTLLDVGAAGSAVSVKFRGGGVETPVERGMEESIA